MITSTPSNILAALLLTVPVALACDTQEKQIGQLDDSTGTGDGTDTAETAEDSAACVAALDSMLALFQAQQGQRCAMVVLFDYETYEASGWHLQCDAGELGLSVDEARALTSWGGDDISEPIDEPVDDRSFIFYTAPNDMGGVGWVSNHVGLMFDASIVGGGVGAIAHPESFGQASELGTGCIAPNAAFEVRAYDLTEETVVIDYQMLHVEEVWLALLDTAVLRAVLLDYGEGLTIDMLAYPRTMAEFEPSSADYVVVLEWGR
jgi:hypothetical protein